MGFTSYPLGITKHILIITPFVIRTLLIHWHCRKGVFYFLFYNINHRYVHSIYTTPDVGVTRNPITCFTAQHRKHIQGVCPSYLHDQYYYSIKAIICFHGNIIYYQS